MLMTPYATLTYKNTIGDEMVLAPFSTFWCLKCEETVMNQIHSVKQAGTHGQYFTGMSMDERYVVITGEVEHGLTLETAMRTLQNAFNPNFAGTLTYYNRRERMNKDISCRIEQLPQVYWSDGRMQFELSLICLDPFWKGQSQIESIAETLKKFKFILKIPSDGMSFGTRKATLESKVENPGNVESGFSAVFRAKYGTVINPEIHNEVTGEKIKLLYTMQKDDVISIVSDILEKRVVINGMNGFKFIDAEHTTFFLLTAGTNRIGYNADENVSNLYVHVRYVPNFTFAEG